MKITFIIKKRRKTGKNKDIEQIKEFLNSSTLYLLPDLHSKVYYNGFQALITSLNMKEYSSKSNHEIGVFFSEEDETHLKEVDQHIQFLISTGEKYLTEDKKKKKKESVEKLPRGKMSEVEFMVISKGTKWIKVISPEGYENKIAIANVPGLKVGKTYSALVKKQWKDTDYGFEVEFIEVKDLRKIAGSCIICGKKIEFDPDKPLCKPCYFKNKQYFGHIFGKFCHYCGEKTENILDSKPLCYSCYSKYLSFF